MGGSVNRAARLIAVVAVALTVSTACTTDEPTVAPSGPSTTAAPNAPTPAPDPLDDLAWGACTEPLELIPGINPTLIDPDVECAAVTAPLDWSSGEGTVNLAVARLRATDPANRIGVLMVNPGGPGVSGIDHLLTDPRYRTGPLGERFDVVTWDPRGTGRSTSVECFDDAGTEARIFAEPIDTNTPDGWRQVAQRQEEFFSACESNSPSGLLDNLSTADTARDMNLIREALGEQQITYLGYSYGTFLGVTYAALFGDTLRAAVLDGGLDPAVYQDNGNAQAISQAAGFSGTLDAWAASDYAQAGLIPWGGPEAALTGLIDTAFDAPIPSVTSPGRTANGATVALAAISALYAPDAWSFLTDAIASAYDGDASLILLLADSYTGRSHDGIYPPALDALSAVACADRGGALDFDTALAEAEQVAASVDDPLGVFGNSLFCYGWDIDASSRYAGPYAAPDAPPIVVVATTGDPATPYAGGVALAEVLDTAVLVTYEGDRHIAYGADDCVDKAVDDYLFDLVVPPDGLTCER